MAQHRQQRMAPSPRRRERAEFNLALPARRRLEAIRGRARIAGTSRADVVSDPAVAPRVAGRAGLVDQPLHRQAGKPRQPVVHDPLVRVQPVRRCRRGEYRIPPVARSRSRSPGAIQLQIVRRLTPKGRDSPAFGTPRPDNASAASSSPVRASATRSIPVGFANSVGRVAVAANPSGVQL